MGELRGKVDPDLWDRVNEIFVDANVDYGTVVNTLIAGLEQLYIHAGAARDVTEARAKLAAAILSPLERKDLRETIIRVEENLQIITPQIRKKIGGKQILEWLGPGWKIMVPTPPPGHVGPRVVWEEIPAELLDTPWTNTPLSTPGLWKSF